MAEDSEDLSEVNEEEDDVGIKKVYDTKQLEVKEEKKSPAPEAGIGAEGADANGSDPEKISSDSGSINIDDKKESPQVITY
jgi:hypothetical protein